MKKVHAIFDSVNNFLQPKKAWHVAGKVWKDGKEHIVIGKLKCKPHQAPTEADKLFRSMWGLPEKNTLKNGVLVLSWSEVS